MEQIHSTTIIAVKKDGKTAMAGDGQATLEHIIAKAHAKKVRRIYNDQVVVGFAGGVADALTLIDRFEAMLQKYSGNLTRSAVELAQTWRRDEAMRKLEAQMIVADKSTLLLVSGAGEVVEPDDGILSIGSGSNYAIAAAKALNAHTSMSAREIAEKSINIAADICIYTNHNITVEEI